MDYQEIKNYTYEQFARICKAVGNAKRFELLSLLTHGEHSVEMLSKETGMSFANTSQHLQNLKQSGLVSSRRIRNAILYRLADPSVVQFLHAARHAAEEQLAEMDRINLKITRLRQNVAQIKYEDLSNAIEKQNAILIDVRPQNEFEAGYIPNAVSIPLNEIENEIGRISEYSSVIVYCRDFYSFLADQAIVILENHHIPANRLEGGYIEWKAMQD
jgi:rhodanese-related sulfurtransferase/biotin operon repressor